jgi:hypothetical protein
MPSIMYRICTHKSSPIICNKFTVSHISEISFQKSFGRQYSCYDCAIISHVYAIIHKLPNGFSLLVNIRFTGNICKITSDILSHPNAT